MLIGADEELLSIARRYINILARLLIRSVLEGTSFKKHRFECSTDSTEADSSILALGTDKRTFDLNGQYGMVSPFWDLGLQ